jgi:hypothetical protein
MMYITPTSACPRLTHHSIRAIKLLAWEKSLATALGRLRTEEMHCLARRKYLDALCVICWASTPVLTSLATFVAVVYIDHDITPAAVFTTIALLQMLTFPLVCALCARLPTLGAHRGRHACTTCL